MTIDSEVLQAERQFFASLLEADLPALERLLADDFLLIDVLSGSQVPRSALLALIAAGELRFEAIEATDPLVRLYRPTAIVTGRTHMAGRYGTTPFSASSRYTHVYAEQDGSWRLVAAQGTPIVPAEPSTDAPA